MNITTRRLTSLAFIAICGLGAANLGASEVVLSLGSESSTSGKAKPAGPFAQNLTVTETKDSVQISTPNFWSGQVQFDGLKMDLSSAKSTSSLAIEVKGSVTGKNPKLRVILFAPGWVAKSAWQFDLTDINPDDYTIVKAISPLATPSEESDGPPLDVNGLVGVMQMITTGQDTDKPWDLEIKSIQIVE